MNTARCQCWSAWRFTAWGAYMHKHRPAATAAGFPPTADKEIVAWHLASAWERLKAPAVRAKLAIGGQTRRHRFRLLLLLLRATSPQAHRRAVGTLVSTRTTVPIRWWSKEKSWQPTAAMNQRAAKLYEQRVAELQAFSNQRKLDTAPTSTVSASNASLRQTHAGIGWVF